ncbi:DUF4347 domain-containing protein [Mesorhizobium yinganensis]|uniref:DUF4347 domain-containing protein n=1 Tax=Mesorhizobium yinganensis TaxID=3157707 RepID=UPI0032B80E7F
MGKPYAFELRTDASVTAYLFVDPRVADWDTLVRDVASTIRVVLLDTAIDGVAQLASALRGVRDLATIHILSHGAPGDIRIGANGLTAANLAVYADELSSIGAALRDGGDILVYGCEVGRGAAGRAFVERLADVTGACVAAAEGPVGAAALGGGWNLSTVGGEVAAPLFVSAQARSQYPHVLDGLPPIASATDGTGLEDDFWITVILNAYDPEDGTDLVFRLSSLPQHGKLYDMFDNEIAAGVDYPSSSGELLLFFVPDTNWSGSTAFDFVAFDLSGTPSTPVVATIDVAPAADMPAVRPGVADSPVPLDIAHHVVTGTNAYEDSPASAGLSGGGFVQVWTQASVNANIQAQLFNADGTANGGVFDVTPGTGGAESQPSVAALPGDAFVVAWTDDLFGQPNVKAAVYAAGSTVPVATIDLAVTAGAEFQPTVTALDGGGFVATWQEQTATETIIHAQRFTDSGVAIDASPVQLTGNGDYGVSLQPPPNAVAALDGGGYVVSWEEGGAIVARVVDAAGVAAAPVTISILGEDVSLAPAATGGFVATWTAGDDIHGAVYDGTGVLQTSFDVATGVPIDFTSSVATLPDGRFVVTWVGNGGTSARDVFAQVFSVDGTPNGGPIAVTETADPNNEGQATVTVLADGNFVVSWVDFANTGTRNDIAYRVYDAGEASVVALEDQAITLPTSVALADADGSEILSQVTVDGLPADFTLTVGERADSGDPTSAWVIDRSTAAEIAFLDALAEGKEQIVLSPAANYNGDFTLSVTATSEEIAGAGSPDTATSTAVLVPVSVAAVNDAPSLSAAAETPTFTENGPAVDLFSAVSIDTGEAGQEINQVTLTVANLADGVGEILGVDGTNVVLTDGTTGTTSANGTGYSVAVVAGVATVTLSMPGGVSVADAQTLIDGLTYTNSSENPDTSDRVVTLTGIRDNGGTDGGGVDTASVSLGATVSISALNDAPTLSGGPVELPSTDEDNPNTEVTVADLLAGTTLGDLDGDDVGIAVTGLTGNGEWEYSTDGGFTWLSFGSVSDGHALLLSPDTLVSYMPDGLDGETATVNFRAWDQTTGTASNDTTQQYADTSVNGGTSAYSNGTAQASVEVEAVNDAPIIRLSPGLDYVVTIPADGTVDVISGDGEGDTAGGSSEDGGVSPTKVLLADFDNDGDLDVAVMSPTLSAVTILENDGCGCLTPTTPVAVMPVPVSMVSGDFNGDGNIDLFVGGTNGIVAELLVGAGDGSFTTTLVPTTFGFGLTELATGDFNADGKLDIAATVAGGVLIGTGNGMGGFAFMPPTPAGVPVPGQIAVGDMDGINGADIVVADLGPGFIGLMTNNGAGGFTTTMVSAGVGMSVKDVQLGDVNGDGKLDIVTVDSVLNTANVVLNAGGGLFAPAVSYAVGAGPSSLKLADMNDDGNLDIVALSTGSEEIHVLLGKGDGTFAPDLTPIPTFGVPSDIAIGQMDTEFESLYPRFLEFTEGDTLVLAPKLELEDVDPDGGTAVGATIYLDDSTGPGGLPGDVLAADTTGTAITAVYDPNTFTLTLTGNDTLANYQKVLRTVTFTSGDDPDGSVADPASYLPLRIVGMTVDDGKDNGEGSSAPILIGITATGAQDDAFTIWENRTLGLGKNLFDDNGDGLDSGPDFVIAEVNGSAGNVGTQITLPSGALLTVNTDGTFDYDPNGAFNNLPGALSGATNLTATDSFTYTLLGGYTATVTVTIAGVDSDGDVLIGNASDNALNGGFGADTMEGKAGNDTYYVNNAGDVVIEVAGEGTADRVAVNTSYALAAGADIEFLNTTNSKGTTAINLQGNALSQTIIGNDGDNFINDGGTAGPGLGSSPDIMIGRGGNDTYAVYNAADVIVEGKNEGDADRVTAGVSYTLGAGVHVEYLNTTSATAMTAINLTGNELAQVITGNAGNNFLDGGKGEADILKGLAGDDIYYARSAGDYIMENAGEGFDRVTASLSYVLTPDAEIEVLNTTSRTATYAIDLTGNRLAQTITGNYGDNILNDGGKGLADRLEGLLGNDTYYVYNAGDVVVENVGEGIDRVAAGVSYKLTAGSEVEHLQTTSVSGTTAIDLTGNTFSQVITCNAGDNVLHGGGVGGADILRGFGGNDTYRVFNAGDVIVDGALQGTDRVMAAVDYTLSKGVEIELFTTNGSAGTSGIDLTGNEFGQEIVGNAGANRLDGKGGADTLRGLGGNDMFVFSTALGAGNVDTIADFNPAGDRMELHKSVFAALAVTGPLLSGYFRANATGTAQDTNDHIIYDTVTGNLYYDADANGAGAGVHFATLTGLPSLSANDFVVV